MSGEELHQLHTRACPPGNSCLDTSIWLRWIPQYGDGALRICPFHHDEDTLQLLSRQYQAWLGLDVGGFPSRAAINRGWDNLLSWQAILDTMTETETCQSHSIAPQGIIQQHTQRTMWCGGHHPRRHTQPHKVVDRPGNEITPADTVITSRQNTGHPGWSMNTSHRVINPTQSCYINERKQSVMPDTTNTVDLKRPRHVTQSLDQRTGTKDTTPLEKLV